MLFLTLIIAALPAFVWLIFFLKEDIHPEPKRLLFYTFIVGGLVSIPVLILQISLKSFFSGGIESSVTLLIGLALIEEVFKFLAVFWTMRKNPEFDEPIDAMIYIIVAAAGFATIENLLIVADIISGFHLLPSISEIGSVIGQVLMLRFVGATFLHVLSSAILGYHWAIGRLKKNIWGFIFQGIIWATIVHSLFNFLVLKFQETNLIYPSMLLIFTLFFVLADFDKLKIRKGRNS